MPSAIVPAALGFAGGSLFGGGGGQESQVVPQSSIRPGQQQLLDRLTQFLRPQIGQQGRVPGQEFAPSGPGGLQRQAFGLPGFGQAQDAFSRSLSFDPQQIANQFAPTATAARQGFEQQTIPSILGALGQLGAARSSGAADILGREGRNLELGLSAQLGQQQFGAFQAAQQRGFQAPGQALGAAGQLFNLGAGQRGIGEEQRQFGLGQFQARDPLRNPAIGLGLQSAGLQTFQQPGIIPGTPGIAQQLLPIGGQLLGAAGQAGGFGNLFSGIFGYGINNMGFEIPRNPTLLESLSQGLQLGLPGLVAGGQQRTQQQALQGLGEQLGLNLPQGLNPQFEQQFILDRLKQPGGAGFTLGQGQQRFDAQGNPIAQVAPAPTAAERPITLGRGDILFDPSTGQQIGAGLPPAPPKPPAPKAGDLTVAKEGDGTGLPPGTVFQADPRGNIKIISEPGGVGLSAADKTKIAITQAKEFRADKRIENLNIVERSERGMAAALKLSLSPNTKSKIASDQALGVLFQKMLDPTSVVRESEFARTPEGAALMSRITSQIPKLLQGGLAISDDDRRALADMAQKLLDEAKITANRAFDEFETRADEIGLNKKIVFGNRKRFDISAAPSLRTDESKAASTEEILRIIGVR